MPFKQQSQGKSPKIFIMAGGTGGHVFPGLAVANLLRDRGWQVHWLGTATRMEAKLVPDAGYPISFIDVVGVRGNGIKRLLQAPFKIITAIVAARDILKREQPDVVLGMGGFAAGPGGIASKLCGIPLLIHEQNALAGMTNKILARLADRVLSGFPEAFAGKTAPKYIHVGNPVRAEIAAIADKTVPVEPIKLLVVGGSLGAQCLNQHIPVVLANLPQFRVLHQSGAGQLAEVEQAFQRSAVTHWQAQEFIRDMASAFDWADLVICRAGALTVAEVAAAGVAAIFVPLPHAVDDHQTQNALSLVNVQAAKLLPQPQLEKGELQPLLAGLAAEPEQLLQMGRRAKQAAKLDAGEKVAALCQSMAEAA